MSLTSLLSRTLPGAAVSLSLLALAALSAPAAHADLLFTNYTGESVSVANANQTLGTEFTVGAQSLLLSRLGAYDAGQDGLSASHQVGIWRVSDQSLLASVTVASGTSAPLVQKWRFASLSSALTLAANTTYRLGALESNPTDGNPFNGTFTSNAGVTATAGSVYTTGGFAYPDTREFSVRLFANADVSVAGAAAAPEPGTIALLLTAGMPVVGIVRRRAVRRTKAA